MKTIITSGYCIISLVLTITLNAQVSVNSSGGETSGTGGSVYYSIGQVMYNTFSSTDHSVAEGIQQPYEISIITGVQYSDINLLITAFPNPVKHHLTLKIKDESWITTRTIVLLYDANGNNINQILVNANETSIDFTKNKPAVYFLKIVQNGKEVKIFKIVKN